MVNSTEVAMKSLGWLITPSSTLLDVPLILGCVNVGEIKKAFDRRNYVEDACRASHSPEWAF